VSRDVRSLLNIPFAFELEKMHRKHGPNNDKDTNPKMSSLLVFNRVFRLEIQSVMLVFSTPLVN
jgi:hypothetical protein